MQQEEIKLTGEKISIFLNVCNSNSLMEFEGDGNKKINPNYAATLGKIFDIQRNSGGVTKDTIKEAVDSLAQERGLKGAEKINIETKLLSNFERVAEKTRRPSPVLDETRLAVQDMAERGKVI